MKQLFLQLSYAFLNDWVRSNQAKMLVSFVIAVLLCNYMGKQMTALVIRPLLPLSPIGTISTSSHASSSLSDTPNWSLIHRHCHQYPRPHVCEQIIMWPSHTKSSHLNSTLKINQTASFPSPTAKPLDQPLSVRSQSRFPLSVTRSPSTLRQKVPPSMVNTALTGRLPPVMQTLVKNTNWKLVSYRILRQLSMLLVDQLLSKVLQFDWRSNSLQSFSTQLLKPNQTVSILRQLVSKANQQRQKKPNKLRWIFSLCL